MPQHIPVVPVALETGSWPTFRLTTQERMEIIRGRGLQRSQGSNAPLMNPTPMGQTPLHHMEPAPVAATPVAQANNIGPGGVQNTGGRTIDAQGRMVGPTAPAVQPVQHVSPGNITPAKPPIRTSGPNQSGSRP